MEKSSWNFGVRDDLAEKLFDTGTGFSIEYLGFKPASCHPLRRHFFGRGRGFHGTGASY